MRVIFAGGGTGGHLYPSMAIAEKLKNKNIEFLFLVSDRGIESRILTKIGYKFIEQSLFPFKGQGFIGKIKAVLKVLTCFKKVYPLLKKDDIVFITGGFVSTPAALAAKIRGCKLYLHEQNSVMGLVNRLFAGISNKVFLSFPDTMNAKGNIVITGNPVRKVFRELEQKDGWHGKLLIFGGSQGSRKLNSMIASSADYLINEGYSIVHQTGEGLMRETIELYGNIAQKYATRIKIYAYIDKPAAFIREADVVICRAGSGSIFEVMAVGTPAVYVPFKAASDNHQYHNAKFCEGMGVGLVIDEDVNSKQLMQTLQFMKENINVFREKIRANPLKDSVDIIIKEMNL